MSQVFRRKHRTTVYIDSNMDQLVQCPVCTLYLHNGMSLESHLDTHPKDQVIKALCTLSTGVDYSSRIGTPLHSERSYRSRSRTPASENINIHCQHTENDRYWRRTPNRTPKFNLLSRVGTPSNVRSGDINFEANSISTSTQCSGIIPCILKTDKTQQAYISDAPVADFEQQFVYYQDLPEDREIKYSHSSEYSALDNSSIYTQNFPPMGLEAKLQPTLLSTLPRRGSDLVKVFPKPNSMLLKTNVCGVQYITPTVKPAHMMMTTAPTYVEKNIPNNMIMTGSIPATHIIETKTVSPKLGTDQFSHVSTTTFTQGTTSVSQNSQIIYREMVHNIDGKPYISSLPTVLSRHDNVTNAVQTNSMYQNVMVVDQFGNTSCVYANPNQVISKTSSIPHLEKNVAADPSKTLIIEVSPITQPVLKVCEANTSTSFLSMQPESCSPKSEKIVKSFNEKNEMKNEFPTTNKGLKILSNIKVEVPVPNKLNMLNTVLDLTNTNDYQERVMSPERILPDLEDNQVEEESLQPITSVTNCLVSNTFSVIKNVGNPPSYKKSISKSIAVDNKLETEYSDNSPVPDLICNEKPSISPCSELSEQGDTSSDGVHPAISPKPECSQHYKDNAKKNRELAENENSTILEAAQPTYRHFASRLNIVYLKKHKKILQIKNAKTFRLNSHIVEPKPTASTFILPEHVSLNTLSKVDKCENGDSVVSVKKFRVDNEYHCSIDEQPVNVAGKATSGLNNSNNLQVDIKKELSNEAVFKNKSQTSDPKVSPLESLRPINVITYGNMSTTSFEEEPNHRELLDLEVPSKNKQFISVMNENYFDENIYADYFNPEQVESYDSVKTSTANAKDSHKETMYVWGEPSQKENEFVLPNFIHESYKIAESTAMDETGMCESQIQTGIEMDKKDTKHDILSETHSEGEVPMNICTDEQMPPRGELSGQESNGEIESPWNGIYQEVTPPEPYDLIARESWLSDGSEVDINENIDNLEGRSRGSRCGLQPTMGVSKELRAHMSIVHGHAMPTCSSIKTYSRLLTAKTIKKDNKTGMLITGDMVTIDSKESITTSMLQSCDIISEDQQKGQQLMKQETKKKRRDLVCPTCKVDQLTEAGFHAHLKVHPLECLTCGKWFYRRSNLALHLKTHLGIKNYECEVCEKRFITRQKLTEHENVHTGRAPVKCTMCDSTFRRYSNMVQHRDRHHLQKKPKVRDFVCHCSEVFHSRAKLQWHMETHDDKPKACPYCSEKFIHSSSLTRHVRRSHNKYFLSEKLKGKMENVSCPVCKQVYLRANLRAHMQTHSGNRPYLCIICNKSFTTKWNLKLHRWTHMSRSTKPFKCNLCKGAFIRHTEYVSHMNSHKAVRPYTCNYCGCQFIRKYNCQRHVREHEVAKRYVCNVPECGKTFHRSYYLSEHMKVHSGARPFSCGMCGKTSSNKSNHNKHVKIHHAREPIATEA